MARAFAGRGLGWVLLGGVGVFAVFASRAGLPVVSAADATTGTGYASEPPIALVRPLPVLAGAHLDQPVWAGQPPGGEAWFVVEKAGRVRRFTSSASGAGQLVLDIHDQVNSRPSEAGLLGFAFHPHFAENRTVFVSYTTGSSPMTSRLSRMQMRPDGSALNPASEVTVLEQAQPYANHNGGHVLFGPDGDLYFGLGDGGSAGDPHANGQNRRTWLGKLLRLDVGANLRRADGPPYRIPTDNPFAQGGGAPEIYAWGLRNPWRFSFNRLTGRLWVADVGQDSWEEIDIVDKGKDYGWRVMEGAHCFDPDPCSVDDHVLPVSEYDHRHGDISVTGGFVYRGRALPALTGQYVFGDFASGRLFTVPADAAGKPTRPPRLLLDTNLSIASFAEDHDGELYVVDYRGGLFRLAPAR